MLKWNTEKRFAKVYFCKSLSLYLTIFNFSRFCIECPYRHITGLRSLLKRYLFFPPFLMYSIEVLRKRQRWASESDTALFRSRNPLSLPLADIVSLILSDKGENLKHKVRNKGSQKIFSVSRI